MSKGYFAIKPVVFHSKEQIEISKSRKLIMRCEDKKKAELFRIAMSQVAKHQSILSVSKKGRNSWSNVKYIVEGDE